MRPFSLFLTLLQATAWIAAKQTTDAIGEAQTRQVNDAAAAKAIHDVISGKALKSKERARRLQQTRPSSRHDARHLTADEKLQRDVASITVQRGSLNAKQTRRLQASCAAGRAPLPGGGCGTEINGCWGAGAGGGDFAGWAAGWRRRLRCVRCACGLR